MPEIWHELVPHANALPRYGAFDPVFRAKNGYLAPALGWFQAIADADLIRLAHAYVSGDNIDIAKSINRGPGGKRCRRQESNQTFLGAGQS